MKKVMRLFVNPHHVAWQRAKSLFDWCPVGTSRPPDMMAVLPLHMTPSLVRYDIYRVCADHYLLSRTLKKRLLTSHYRGVV